MDNSSAPGWGFLASDLNHETTYGVHINEKYYVMANYTRFIRPGFIFVAVGDPQSLAAYDPNSGTLVVVKTNDTGDTERVRYRLSGFTALGSDARAYRTTRYGVTDNLKSLPLVALRDGTLSVAVPPYSVTTYVIHADYRPPLTDIPKSAFHGIRQGQNLDLRFHGRGIWVYGTKGPDDGMAQFRVTGQMSETLDLYAPRKEPRVLLYASPTLPAGTHRLTVRVTGLRNFHADGTAVTVAYAAAVRTAP